MTTDPDDALRWEGDESEAPSVPATKAPEAPQPAPTPAAAPSEAEPRSAGAGNSLGTDNSVSTDAAADAGTTDDAHDESVGIGNVALVFYGIIGGVYLLFAVGWIVGGLRLRPRASLLLADWMYFPWMWLAALASLLWFAAAWVLTRGRASWVRIAALIAGVVLLVPWPFVMFGMVGS